MSAAEPPTARERRSAALATWSTARLLRSWPREPLWQRRIAELLLFARTGELDVAAWRHLTDLMTSGRIDAHVVFFVRCRGAVLQRDLPTLLELFPAGCEYPDWIRAAGDLALANAHVLERWEALLRGRHYASLSASRREVVLALGKLGAVVGPYAAELCAKYYIGDAADAALRAWTIARCTTPATGWVACDACRHGVVVEHRRGWWRAARDFAVCATCGGRPWLPREARD